ncbi:MAG: hypothetical protein RI996_238 [Candidatus Parcubacteria bacterium]|jgi:hypothetical protein
MSVEHFAQTTQEPFKTPEEEIAYLRAQIKEKEAHLENKNTYQDRAETIKEVVAEYSKKEAFQILHQSHPYIAEVEAGISLPLRPEKDDDKMAELLGIMAEGGVKKALTVLAAMQNPHLEDDFHRFLVQYLVAGLAVNDLSKDKEFFKSINMILYEVVLPENEGEKEKSFKEEAALMEQLYASLSSFAEGKNNEARNYFSLEIGLPNGSNEVVFYASVPRVFKDIFEKQISSLYPKARLLEKKDDYNIFNEDGASIGVYARPKTTAALPIKLYSEFEKNPITLILNTFDKLKQHGEGAAIQVLVMPRGDIYTKKFGETLDSLKKGKKLKEISSENIDISGISKTAVSFFTGNKPSEEKKTSSYVDEDATTKVSEKIASTIFDTNIRIVVSAENTERAQMMRREIESAFKQFDEPKGNHIVFEEVHTKKKIEFLRDFSYRRFDTAQSYPLNTKELTSLYHFPSGIADFAQLKQSQNQSAPAPLDLPTVGTLLGINKYRHLETPVYIGKEDRVRHFYVVGQTGTGKTSILKNMIIQDIKAGHGCCFIDPHGSDIDDILASIPPERVDDVIYFDPSNTERVMGLNMLEFDPRFPEQKSNVVDELFGIFNKLFDMKTSGGPAFEQYFRNAAFTVMAHPESGNTLMEIGRVMSDKKFRDAKLEHVTNPLIKQFWANAEKTTGEAGLSNFVPYITNKFDVFLSNDYMRPIVTQEKSSFNFRDIMDGKKIFLANLAKGRLGDINSSLLGLIIVGKITMAALSRVDAAADKRPDFYLYIDEFQNFTTPSITTILSEARKYRLSLNIAHQYIGQLPDDIKGAIFGNVGSMAVFRVGVEDAEFLSKYFNPPFTAHDIVKLENFNAYIKMLSGGNPQKPFNIATVSPEKGDSSMAQGLKDLSALKFGRPRAELEAALLKKYDML